MCNSTGLCPCGLVSASLPECVVFLHDDSRNSMVGSRVTGTQGGGAAVHLEIHSSSLKCRFRKHAPFPFFLQFTPREARRKPSEARRAPHHSGSGLSLSPVARARIRDSLCCFTHGWSSIARLARGHSRTVACLWQLARDSLHLRWQHKQYSQQHQHLPHMGGL